MQYKRGRLRNAENEFYFMPRPAARQATSGQIPEARTHGGRGLTKSGHMADEERTRSGYTQDRHKRPTPGGQGLEASRLKSDTRRAHGEQRTHDSRAMADACGQGLEARTWRNQGGHKPDNDGHMAKRSPGGHLRRTHGGQAPGTRPGHIAASLFF